MIHIYTPAATMRTVRWHHCPDCGKRSPFAALYYEWHGPRAVCMRCGRGFSDGYWMPLDFSRTARKDNKAQMRAAWKRANPSDTHIDFAIDCDGEPQAR